MASSETRIDVLRQRVIEEPGSRAFVLLAEEYRHDGRLGEALSTLEAGLAVQPDYLAARIALGRGQLEAHLVDQGIRTLELVVRTDKTQMVAYRLLIGAHAERGDSASAQHALTEYTLLNPQDPELQFLEDIAGSTGGAPLVDDHAAKRPLSPSSEFTAQVDAAPEPELRQPPFSLRPPTVMAPELGSLEPRPLRRPRPLRVSADEQTSSPPGRLHEESQEKAGARKATATLAELYLRQGHIEEAAEIYRRILSEDPDSQIARASLDALAEGSTAQPAKPASFKLELYRSYAAKLATLREERSAHA